MSLGTILLIIVVLLLIGALPTWPHSAGWGCYPPGWPRLVVVILLILRCSDASRRHGARRECAASILRNPWNFSIGSRFRDCHIDQRGSHVARNHSAHYCRAALIRPCPRGPQRRLGCPTGGLGLVVVILLILLLLGRI